jgi:hypothetical protein
VELALRIVAGLQQLSQICQIQKSLDEGAEVLNLSEKNWLALGI